MKKNMLLVVDSVSNEKGIEREIIVRAVEEALASVTQKCYEEPIEVRVAIDRNTGDYDTFRVWTVIADDALLENPAAQILLSEARKMDVELNVGDSVEELIESVDFGRIGAHQAKQIIMRMVRDAERSKVAEEYESRIGQLITGQVKRCTRQGIVVELGHNAEGHIPRDQLIPREAIRNNDRVRAYVYGVKKDKKGPQILLSRTHPKMLAELFKIEVPEIAEEVIEIKAVARDPGLRAKIAVKTNDGRIDPIGACVGMRGSRVQSVSSELNGERIDIVLWEDNPAQLVISVMLPAEVSSIVMDEEAHTMDIGVPKDQLPQAIGRSGQNIRLASQLSGWTLNVMSEEEAKEKAEQGSEASLAQLTQQLDIDEEMASVLVEHGFSRIEDVAQVTTGELLEIEEFDEEIVEELRSRAKNVLLVNAMSSSNDLGATEPAEDLLNLEGMTRHLAFILASHGIVTREDLADQSIEDLSDLKEMDRETAGSLIMEARKIWFQENAGS